MGRSAGRWSWCRPMNVASAAVPETVLAGKP
jgi:hypothetical protein